MKNKLLIRLTSIFMLLSGSGYGQNFYSSKSINVYVTKLKYSSEVLNKFIASKQGVISQTNLNSNQYDCVFSISIEYLGALDSIANSMGYVTANSYNTSNISEKINESQNKIEGLRYENQLYEKQYKDSTYLEYGSVKLKNKIELNNEEIKNAELLIMKYNQNSEAKMCKVNFTIYDELSTPNDTRVSFVNMPGGEYGYLFIENPKAGVSAKAYQGATIKYMFTRGKSYFNLGVYKAVDNNKQDSTLINELFMITFGQDFYPKNFGRGKRKYLNLYTGYQAGGFILNRNYEKNSSFVPNVNLSLGLELLKTKHVLIDNKVSYFLPLNDLNRNMRGIMYQASFNFVF